MFKHQIGQILNQTSSSLRLEAAAAAAPVEDQAVARVAEWAVERPEDPAGGLPVEWGAADREAPERVRAPERWMVVTRAQAAQEREAAARASPIQEWEAAAQEARVPEWGRGKQDRSRAASKAAGLKRNKRSSLLAPASPVGAICCDATHECAFVKLLSSVASHGPVPSTRRVKRLVSRAWYRR